MKNLKYYLLFICISLSVNLYAQNKACNGVEYTTDKLFYRATSNGSSPDVTASKKKALSNARNSLITQISTDVEGAINKQKIEDANKKKMIELSMIAIRQEAGNIKVICENSNQQNRKYVSNVVIEISKDNLIKGIIAMISNDNTLNGQLDIDNFKKSL